MVNSRCCAFLGAMGLALSVALAAAQESEPARAGESPATAPADTRPAFVLPDVVVEGEDLSRLSGGLRLLELDVPGVSPQQEPLPVAPEATRYRRRQELSFRSILPGAASPDPVRGLLRAAGDQGPGGSLSLAYLPSAGRPAMLWGDLRAWSGHWNENEHLEGGLGYLAVHPRARIGCALRGTRTRRAADAADAAGVDSTLALLQAMASLEMGIGGRGAAPVLHVTGFTGRGSAVWEIAGAGGARRTAHWLGGEVGLVSGMLSGDLRPGASSPAIDMRLGAVYHDGPADSSEVRLQARGRLGWRLVDGRRRANLGLAGGGDRDHGLITPWITAEWLARGNQMRLRAELAPAVTYPRELLAGADALPGPGELRDPAAPLLARSPWLPPAGLIDLLLPPQRAWPRLSGELLLCGSSGWLQLTAMMAELRQPLGWVRTADAPGEARVYRLATRADRVMASLDIDARWRIGRNLEVRAAYAWRHDADHDTDQALYGWAVHEAQIALDGRAGGLFWTCGAHGRDTAAAAEPLAAYCALRGGLGLRLGHTRIMLAVENLLDEEIELCPGDGFRGRWLRLVWEQVLAAVP